MSEPVILVGDNRETLKTLAAGSVHCCVTSPPYWGLRDYGHDDQIGLEESPDAYVEQMVGLFREVGRVLRDDGTLWLNLGDSYNGSGGIGGQGKQHTNEGTSSKPDRREGWRGLKPKNLVGIPWRVAFALQADGWILRSDIVWHKPNAMPGSQQDRPTTAHEYVFLLAKQQRYFFDMEAIKERAEVLNDRLKNGAVLRYGGAKFSEGGPRIYSGDQAKPSDTRSKRSVWSIPVASSRDSHFAVFPSKLVEPCIMAGTSEAGCCASCGAPLVRTTERERTATRPGKDTKVTGDSLVDGNRDPQRHVTMVRTKGWEASCACGAGVKPCVVLDPFGGSGTTAQVARHLGRDSVICELNPDYAEIARKKIRKNPYASSEQKTFDPHQRELF